MLTSAVEQTADSIMITDRDGLIGYVNPAFEQTTGYPLEEVLGQTPRLLKSGKHGPDFYRGLWTTITSGQPFREVVTNRKRSGELFLAEQTITPIKDPEGKITHFVSVIKDVTEQRKAEEQRSQMALARTVQQRFYSVRPPQVTGFEIAGSAFPADATGGDYFDFISLPDGCLAIAVGDVSGHGISSALLMAELRASVRASALTVADPGEIFRRVNAALVSDLAKNEYATLIMCRLDPARRSIAYASAGHVSGYILKPEGRSRGFWRAPACPSACLRTRSPRAARRSRLRATRRWFSSPMGSRKPRIPATLNTESIVPSNTFAGTVRTMPAISCPAWLRLCASSWAILRSATTSLSSSASPPSRLVASLRLPCRTSPCP